VAVLALFLLHQPLKVWVKDYRAQRSNYRTQWAKRFCLLYATLGLGATVGLLPYLSVAWWFVAAALLPLIAVQLAFDLRNASRALVPELAGAAALNGSVVWVALLGGWQLADGLLLWGLLLVRTVPSIIYIRARLQQLHHKPIRLALPLGALVGGVVLVAGGSVAGIVPPLTLLMPLVLLLRGVQGLAQGTAPMKASTLGFREIGYGILAVGIIVVAY
jgi:hypothetical protein